MEHTGLGVELLRGSGRLLRLGGGRLHRLLDMDHGGADVRNAARLLASAGGDFADEGVHLPGMLVDLGEGGRDALANLPAIAGAGDGVLDLAGGLAGGGGGTLGQTADFVGDHGKTHPGLSGARRFDGRVEGEDVGLKRDLVDGLDDFGDAGARRLDFVHGAEHRFHFGHALVGGLLRFLREGMGALGVLDVALGHAVEFLAGRTGFLDRGGLRAGAARDGAAGLADAGGGGGNLLRPDLEVVGDIVDGAGDAAGQPPDDGQHQQQNSQAVRLRSWYTLAITSSAGQVMSMSQGVPVWPMRTGAPIRMAVVWRV